jgi:hypothetical protein
MVAEWPAEPGWRVRTGVGLVIHAPLSDERQAIIAREAEKERKALELEEQARRDAALERRWDLQRQGVVAHSVSDVLASASFGMDRADKAEERREREAAEVLGKPAKPWFDKWESKANVAAAEAAREVTPASKADLRQLESAITSLKAKLHALGGRP